MWPDVYLAAEDEPGLAIGRKLIANAAPLRIYREENARGTGNLKNKIRSYQKMGVRMPVLMITDLDEKPCPSKLIKDWLGVAPSKGFLFRICVREVEAWLLAHREAMAAFLNIAESKLPMEPEKLTDPKAELIRLARHAPRNIRVGLTPVDSATIGPNYNMLLKEFIQKAWSPAIASARAPSLERARQRIDQLAALVARA